ncbi:MAG: hypothetical protein ACIAQ0_10170 [Phycisphaerales bacterium JB058]
MNLTRKWQAATLALMLSSGAVTAPAAAQSAGEDVEMERIVIALPNGKRIVRYVPRTTKTDVNDSSSGNSSGSGSNGGGSNNNNEDETEWYPDDIPDDLQRQVAQWLLLYRAGNMAADANGDGRLTPADYSAYIERLNAHGGHDDGLNGGGTNNAGNNDDGDDDNNDGGGGGDDDDSDDNGDNNYTEGWTDLSPAPESRVIYVSSTLGNDSNDGLSPAAPLRTIDRGLSKLRSGQPDWLLFKRGDTFSGIFGSFKFSGMSEDKPMVIGAYGEGPRPKFYTGTSPAFNLAGSHPRHHVAITSLHLEPGSGHPAGGIRIVTGAVEDFLIEDCYLNQYYVNIIVQGSSSDKIENVRIRRNVILDARGSTHAQAIYSSHTHGLLIEGNIIDRNGWDSDAGRSASATIFAHNCYIQRSTEDLVFKNNIVMRAGSHGIQARKGGILEGNIFYQNPMSIMMGNEGGQTYETPVYGTIKRNVILEGIDISPELRRGDGIVIQHTAQIEVTENILSRNLNEPSSAYGISIDGPSSAPVRNALIANNIVHDWDLPFRVRENAVSVTFRDNILTNSDDDKHLIKHRDAETINAVTYSGNRYKRAGDQDWFQVGSSDLSLPEWNSDHGDGSQILSSPFVDDTRTFDTYARSIGLSGADELIEAMRSVRKGDWDERLTAEAIGEYFREGFTQVNTN